MFLVTNYLLLIPIPVQRARINHQIKAPEVRVIDSLGKMLGVMKLSDALSLALERGVDLVEVSPTANPPVAKLLDYDKFRYQQEKAAREARKKVKKVTVKETKLSVRISQHDLDFKAKKTDEFLSQGHKVKIDIRMRGREQAHPQLAYELMKKFQSILTISNAVEAGPSRMGGTVSIILAPK